MENIKEIMDTENKPMFVERKKPDADAAYERLRTIRHAVKELRLAINNTNTVGMPESLKDLYSDMFIMMLTIEAGEQELIKEGE